MLISPTARQRTSKSAGSSRCGQGHDGRLTCGQRGWSKFGMFERSKDFRCQPTLRHHITEGGERTLKKTDTRPDARHPDAFLSICGVDFSIGRHCSFKPISHFASSRTTAKHTSVQSRSNTGFPTPFQPQDFSINCDRRRIVYKNRKRPRWVSNSCRILNSERLDGQVTHPSHQHSLPPFRRNAYRHTGFRMLPSPFSSYASTLLSIAEFSVAWDPP